jgi:DNA processing protein
MSQLTLSFDAPAPAEGAAAAAARRPLARSVSPLAEMGAYEALWLEPRTTFASLAERFRRHPGALPSELADPTAAAAAARAVLDAAAAAGVERLGVRIHGAGEYPARLRDARHPVELLYFQGWWSLIESPCVAVVGTRRPTPAGLQQAEAVAAELAAAGWTVVSGLARGVDTAAHLAALRGGGRTVAVLGTPLTDRYPPENATLQAEIAAHFLVISQVPVLRHHRDGWRARRRFFPERNATMSALTAATVIVEAGETSGTLHQARAALDQGRKLLILDSCFQVPGLSWPRHFEQLGAVRIKDLDHLREQLGTAVGTPHPH